MKKFTLYFKTLVLFGLFVMANTGSAQTPCSSSFVYTINPNGYVNFSSTSTTTSGTTAYNWYIFNMTNWVGLSPMSGLNPSYTFSVNGTYQVSLIISNSAPTCTALATQTFVITNAAPICSLNANFSISQGSSGMVTLNNTSTGTVPGVTYLWDFGDNSPTSTALSPVHTYSADGVYSATLTANNNFTSTSCTSTIIQTVKICSYAPMTSSYSYTPNSGGNVTFTSTSTGTTPATIYNWFFYSATTPSVANGVNLTQTSANYPLNGSYPVYLQIINPVSTCSAISAQTIVITNTATPCYLYPYFYISQGANGLVTFNNQSFGTAPSATYFWNFGDNSTSTAVSPVHTYSADGVYTATFTVNNNFLNTCTSTTIQTVKICSYASMTPSFSYTPNSGGNVTFTSTSTGTTPATIYNWTFFSAMTPSVANGVNLTQTSANYPVNGNYGVYFQITNPVTTCSAATIQSVVISTANPPCNLNANFSVSQGANGLVTLNNLSSGTVGGTTYFWNFGDNSTSTAVSPVHTYSADGVYTTTLTVNNNFLNTCTSTTIHTVKICSYASMTSSYSYTPNSGGNVTFTSTSTGTTPATIYNWSFYSAMAPSVANGVNLSQTSANYSLNGTYYVYLQITNPVSTCSAISVQSIVVTNTATPCTINANFSINQGSNGLVTLNNTSTGTVTGTTYFWNFGDNSPTSNLVSPVHTYSADGVYTVTLTVNNNFINTCTSTIIKTVKICSYAPMTSSYSYTPNSGGNVTFTSTSTGTTAATIYNWYFNSATTPSVGVNLTQTSANYSVNGTYYVYLQITNPVSTCSAISVQSIVITTTVTPCTLYTNFNFSQGANGLVTFNNQSTGTAPGATYFWNFGDNSTGNAVSPVHTYSADGVYTATLTVNNNFLNTCTSTTIHTVKICSYAPMTPSFSYTPNSGGNVTFTSTSTGTTPATIYNWSFYSATTPTVSGVNLTQTSANFSVNGSYTATLTISNPVTTCSASVGQIIVVSNSNQPCNVNANFSISQGANGLVTLNNLSSGTVGGTTYFWNFGDNSTSNLVSPVHTYSADGVYTATLTANNNYTSNCASTIIKTVKICSYAPLNASYLYTVNGPIVTFTSTSTGTNANTLYNWYGYNGIGSFGSGANVTQAVVTYTANGLYPVLLQISNPVTTCSASVMHSVSINFCTANASFDLTPTGTPQFWNATPVSPANVASAVWYWGDGSTSNTLYTSHTYSAAGTYSICLSVTLSCGATNMYCNNYAIFRSSGANQDQDVIQVNVIDPTTVGIKNNTAVAAESFIAPNPNDGSFNLNIGGLNDEVNIFIYDVSGKMIYNQVMRTNNGSLIKEIILEKVPTGMYFLKAESGVKIFSKKIIVEK